MVSIFLNVGGFLLVSKIGINAPDVIIDTNIKGSKFIGLLKFKKKHSYSHRTIQNHHIDW